MAGQDHGARVGHRCPDTAARAGAQEGRGVLGTSAGCLCPPSRSLSIYPLPASCFCFGATGTSSSHHGSKWLAGLSWRPSGWGGGHPGPSDSCRGREGGALRPWVWRGPCGVDWPSPQLSTTELLQLVGWSLWCGRCSRPRWGGSCGLTLSGHGTAFLPQTGDQEGLLPSPASCFLPGLLELDTGPCGQHHIGPCHICTHVHTHSPTRSHRGGLAWGGPTCAHTLASVCGILWNVHMCTMCVCARSHAPTGLPG